MLIHSYETNENIQNCAIGKDKNNRLSYAWPIPPGETHRIPSIYLKANPKSSRGERLNALSKRTKEEIEDFIDYTLKKNLMSRKEVFSDCRFKHFVKMRALFAYAIRTRWKLNTRDTAPFIHRDYSTLNTLQKIAVREYGPDMKAVGDALKAWDEYRNKKG